MNKLDLRGVLNPLTILFGLILGLPLIVILTRAKAKYLRALPSTPETERLALRKEQWNSLLLVALSVVVLILTDLLLAKGDLSNGWVLLVALFTFLRLRFFKNAVKRLTERQ